MNAVKLTAIALSASLALSVSLSAIALADGMPFKEKKPEPVLTPLDQALDEIQNKEPPVDVMHQPAPEEAAPAPVVAEEPAPVPESRIVEVQPDSSFFGLSVGMYDPFTHGTEALSFNLEFQPGVKIAGVLQPLFGALATTEGTLMGYGGLGVPFHLGERVLVMPSIAVGAYEAGDGFDLGRTLAFRGGAEIAYEFDDKSRLGLNAHIITNGTSLQREDRTEVIGLVYTMPLGTVGAGNAMSSAIAPSPDAGTAPPPEENAGTGHNN